MGQWVLLQTNLWNFLKLLFYTAVVCVVASLTLLQIIWLPVLWIGMVFSVERQGRWPRINILKICISFFYHLLCISYTHPSCVILKE